MPPTPLVVVVVEVEPPAPVVTLVVVVVAVVVVTELEPPPLPPAPATLTGGGSSLPEHARTMSTIAIIAGSLTSERLRRARAPSILARFRRLTRP
jgi:hypothetical protein